MYVYLEKALNRKWKVFNNLENFEINKVALVYLCNASLIFPSAPNPTPYSYQTESYSKKYHLFVFKKF